MKFRFLLPFFLASLVWAQSDISVSQPGPNYALARGKSWGVSGTNGINNGYIIPLPSGTTGLCVTVRSNNPTSAHSFTPAVDTTTDPTATGLFAGFTGWISTYSVVGGNAAIASANSAYTFYAPTPGGVFAEVVVLGSTPQAGTPDTVDLTAVAITNSVTSCPGTSGVNFPLFQGNPNGSDGYGYTGVRRGIFCDGFAVFNVATATNQQLAKPPGPYPGTVQAVHVCGYVITGAPTTSANLTFALGTAGTCAVLGATVWEETSNTGNLRASQQANGGTQLFDTAASPGQPLCFRDNGTTSGVKISVAFTIFQ